MELWFKNWVIYDNLGNQLSKWISRKLSLFLSNRGLKNEATSSINTKNRVLDSELWLSKIKIPFSDNIPLTTITRSI